MRIIAAVLGAYFIYLLQRYLYRRFWNHNLTVTLSFSDNRAVEGEELILYETVRNQKLLPVPVLKIKFLTSRFLTFLDLHESEVTDHTYRNDMVSVMMYQKLTRSIPFLCSKRGFYTIDKMHLVSNDLLLEAELVDSVDVALQLYVYPKPLPYTDFSVPFQNMLGLVLAKRYMNEDPFEFKSIREYQSYDTMKTINWKASAKTGSLMVNVYDYTASQQIKILLNLEADTVLKHEDLEEESIRLAAAIAAHFIDLGIPTSFHTNARDCVTQELLWVPAGSGNNHLQTINETLARIDTSLSIPAFVPTLLDEQSNGNANDYIILISFYQRKDLQEQLSLMSRKHVDFSWIVPINREIRLNVDENLLSYVLPWELGGSPPNTGVFKD